MVCSYVCSIHLIWHAHTHSLLDVIVGFQSNIAINLIEKSSFSSYSNHPHFPNSTCNEIIKIYVMRFCSESILIF